MILNQKKTKVMIFNFTDNYKFTAKLELNGEMLDVVKEAKLLGVIITDDLKWDRNTDYIVKKANMRMELLRKVANFSTFVKFPIFSWNTSAHLGYEVITPKCLNASMYFCPSSVSGHVKGVIYQVLNPIVEGSLIIPLQKSPKIKTVQS